MKQMVCVRKRSCRIMGVPLAGSEEKHEEPQVKMTEPRTRSEPESFSVTKQSTYHVVPAVLVISFIYL
jgi:hypothetical protein